MLATPLVCRALVVSLFVELLLKAAMLSGWRWEKQVALTDFELFHMVGRMVWRGELLDAYQIASLLRAEQAMTGIVDFMPWTYPPPFDLVAALLACGPLGLSYCLFTGTTLAAFLVILRRIAGPRFPLVLLAIYPAALMTVACGQNGFLTGALIGWAALALRRDHAVAGVPLGLMVLKPHLAIAFAVHGLARGRWRVVAVAIATAGLASAIAGLVLGPAIWGAFLAATREASVFLAEGHYPLRRMISVYAALRSFGLPAETAFLGQAIVALSALALLVLASRRPMPADRLLGVTCLATLLISPYAYDYDLPISGIALGFLMPDLLRCGRRAEVAAVLILSGVAGAGGWLSTFWIEATSPAVLAAGVTPGVDALAPSAAGLVMLALVALILRVLRRDGGPALAPASRGEHHGVQPLGNARSAVVL